MKKILAILTVAAIFAACSNGNNTSATDSTTNSTTVDSSTMNRSMDTANKMMDSASGRMGTDTSMNKMSDTSHHHSKM